NARGPRIVVSVTARTTAGIHRADLETGARGLRHRGPTGVRAREVVAPHLPQSAGAAHQGRAALQAQHRRDECPVPPGAITMSTPDSAGVWKDLSGRRCG